ncbi:MAG: hypothetical protein N2248_00425 [candidate division WOR-3 bacterium]|nr:hypothetical protein [candidate division WOR-3 bacterium]
MNIRDWLNTLKEVLEKLGIIMPPVEAPTPPESGPGIEVDINAIRDASTQIIFATGQLLTRKRLKTPAPPSFDQDYGEVLNRSEEDFDSIILVGKVFFNPEERLLFSEFGGLIEAAAVVHFPWNADVKIGDFLIIDSNWFIIRQFSTASLRGYLSCAIDRIFPHI